jgi:hypothetical protein
MYKFKVTITPKDNSSFDISVDFKAENDELYLTGNTTVLDTTEENAHDYAVNVFVPDVQRNDVVLRHESLVDEDAPVVTVEESSTTVDWTYGGGSDAVSTETPAL